MPPTSWYWLFAAAVPDTGFSPKTSDWALMALFGSRVIAGGNGLYPVRPPRPLAPPEPLLVR